MSIAVDPSQRLLRRRLVVVSLLAASLAATASLSDPNVGERAAGAEPADPDLAETARFLAGKSTAPTRTQAYTEYAARLDAGWKQFQQPNLERMRAWWTGHGPEKSATVFYPFSGPDIGNALAFFPDADTYLMFGLEAPGAIPDLRALDDAAISAGLSDLEASLSTILQVNYFFTRAMEKKLGNGSFNSVSGLLLFFLATSDCEVTSARGVAIDREGALVYGTGEEDSRVPGVEVTFRRSGSAKAQTIRYFRVNVADASLAKSGFVPYLEGQGRFATMIKSASYLMHEPARFARIRSLILDRSDLVVQDDSGVPLRLFPRDAWKLRFHGHYDAPTREFAKHLQKDLRVEMQRNSTGKLPFSYGYAFKQGASNLLIAERAQ
jgi:hypothetical protein